MADRLGTARLLRFRFSMAANAHVLSPVLKAARRLCECSQPFLDLSFQTRNSGDGIRRQMATFAHLPFGPCQLLVRSLAGGRPFSIEDFKARVHVDEHRSHFFSGMSDNTQSRYSESLSFDLAFKTAASVPAALHLPRPRI